MMFSRFSIIIFCNNCDTNALINGKSEFIKLLSVFLFEWLYFNLFFVAEAYERLSANALSCGLFNVYTGKLCSAWKLFRGNRDELLLSFLLYLFFKIYLK